MGTELAKAYVQIVPSAKGIKGAIQSELSPEAAAAGDQAGEQAGNNLISKIKGVVAAAGIGAFFKQAFSEGADLQQSFQGGLDTLYGDAADQARLFAVEAAKAGISANDYAEQAVSFGAALKQALGGDVAAAASAANTAIMDMADNSAKMGTDIASVQNAYQGFAKGNYTMLDNLKLGYGGTRGEMERLLADAQAFSGVEYNIDNLSDVYSAIHVIQGELGLSGVAADEAATTFSGSLAAMKAAFSNTLGQMAIGGDVSASMGVLIESVSTFVTGNMLPMAGQILSSIPGLIGQVIPGIVSLIPEMVSSGLDVIKAFAEGLLSIDWLGIALDLLTGLAEMLDSASIDILGSDTQVIQSFLDSITNGLPQILEKGVEIISNIVGGVLESLPSVISSATELISGFIGSIVDSLPQIVENGRALVTNLVSGLAQNLPAIIAAAANLIVQLVGGLASHFPEIIRSGLDLVSALISGILQSIGNLIGALPQIFTAIKKSFSGFDWKGIGKSIIDGIGNGIKNFAGNIVSAAKDAAKSAFEGAKKALGIASPSKVFRDDIGKMIDLGMASGISDNAGVVSDAMDRLSLDTVNNVRVDRNYGSITAPAAGRETVDVARVIYDATRIIVAAIEAGGDVYIDGKKATSIVRANNTRINKAYGV